MATPGIQKVYSNITVANPILILPPVIPGLEVWAYFGTDTLGQAGNLVPGGPVLAASGAGPTYQSNYAVFNPGSALGALDTTIQRTAAIVASGWSMLWCSQDTLSSGPQAVVTDGSTGAFLCAMNNNSALLGSVPAMQMGINGAAAVSGTCVQVGPQLTMKCYGLTWAGAGTPIVAYDLTAGVSGAIGNVTMVANTNTLKIGDYVAGSQCSPINIAQWMFASGALSAATMLAIGTSLTSIMATRGFTTV